MEITDLMHGNIVFDDENKLSKIIGFAPLDYLTNCISADGCQILLNHVGDESRDLTCESSFCDPVEITDDILKGFGFINKPMVLVFQKEISNDFIVTVHRFQTNPLHTLRIFKGNKYDKIVHIEIKYAHQLQNLCYLVTGTSLNFDSI